MSLSHAILGLLTITPMSGYDLKTRAFDNTIAHFWQADQTQIYRTLGTMSEQGWIESHLEVQTDRPNRKVYHITEAGRAELRRWLQTEQALPVYREPFLVQMFFAAELDTATILSHIAHHRAGHKARLKQYQQIPIPPLGAPELDYQRTFWRLTLEMGMAIEQAYLNWLDQCEAFVRSAEQDSSESF